MIWPMVLVFTLAWPGTLLIIDAIIRVRRKDLAERLAPFHRPQSVADEAERWLRSQ